MTTYENAYGDFGPIRMTPQELQAMHNQMSRKELTMNATAMYRAETAAGVYCITRKIAGGAFTAHFNGEELGLAAGTQLRDGSLRAARAAARRHNGAELDWTDCAQERALNG